VKRDWKVVSPRYVNRAVEICLFFALACSCCSAFDSDRTLAQFAHTAWEAKDGAPSIVRTLAQSADGYLWLGSNDGLYRFDGLAFERYLPQSGGPFPARRVNSLWALPNGDLWIGFIRGISLLRDGHATNYTTRDGVPEGAVSGFAQDREGTIWCATASGLARLEGSRWKEVGKDWNFLGKTARAIFVDRQGTLWISTEDTLVFLPRGSRRFQPTGIKVGIVPIIAQAASGKLWIAETTRSVRPMPLADSRRPSDETEVRVGSQGILFDREGALWITSLGDGLRRSAAPELLKGNVQEFSTAVESFTTKNGLSGDIVLTSLQDREGDIWVGTNNGLDRFRKTNLVPVVLPFQPGHAVLAAGDAGDAWVASLASLFRVYGGRVNPAHPLPGTGLSAYRDPTGAIWWLCTKAIYLYNARKYTRFALPPSFPQPYVDSAFVATEDESGTLWLAAEGEGLFYLQRGEWQRLETASDFAKLHPRVAYTDWTGRVWFGYEEGTVLLLKNEHVQRVFPADDSPVGSVRAINGRGRHIWVGGEIGLVFFDGSHFRRISPVDAGSFGLVMGIEETLDGSLWLAENRGVIQIPAAEVRQTLENPSYRVKYRVFDSFDGLPGTFAGTATNKKMIQGTNGKLWFAASDGIVWIDPANIFTNTLPPPVLIRSVTANGRQFDSPANLVLPARTSNLQIRYTALSLSVPEKAHFRYRLEGVDKDWQDAGIRREAFYTRLGPGEYHFRVIGSNSDGVWNEEGARLDFNIAPAWYQMRWFYTLCAVASLALIWAIYQLRFHQLQRQFNMMLEERVDERTRIARELHDTLLQTFQGLLMHFQAVSNELHEGEPKQELDEAIDRASRAITEARDAVQGLRSSVAESNDLAAAVGALGRELAAADSAPREFTIQVEGARRSLHPILRDEVYRVAGEALRNAFQHADARRIEVEIRYDERRFWLRVRDDGKGIDPNLLVGNGRAGHFGLAGMRERAKRVGGKLTVWSEVKSGTEVELRIPASHGYARYPAPRRRWWLTEKFLGKTTG
jgi:signal transduction histidine kinase/ligand-binding sensor domain-containing protein